MKSMFTIAALIAILMLMAASALTLAIAQPDKPPTTYSSLERYDDTDQTQFTYAGNGQWTIVPFLDSKSLALCRKSYEAQMNADANGKFLPLALGCGNASINLSGFFGKYSLQNKPDDDMMASAHECVAAIRTGDVSQKSAMGSASRIEYQFCRSVLMHFGWALPSSDFPLPINATEPMVAGNDPQVISFPYKWDDGHQYDAFVRSGEVHKFMFCVDFKQNHSWNDAIPVDDWNECKRLLSIKA